MFALRSKSSHAGAVPMLPRWLRRPARVLRRVFAGQVDVPPFAATIASGSLFFLAGTYGALQGGHLDDGIGAVTARAGLAIEDVEVVGNRETSEIDVLQRIGLDGWTSMVGFDVRAARERIAELPWVEAATVRKVYPATIEVQIVEREPFALWQRANRLFVIEEDGDVIAPFSGGRHTSLPLVIGAGAAEAGPEFVADVSRVRGLAGRVRAYVRVADRRWNLILDNGVTIKLPENDVEAAMAEASRLDADYALFARDITAIDLRLPDRLTIALTPEAAETRKARFEERLARQEEEARI
ncbi:cell division protein FtsQ/DivIB [Chelativorans sp. YIM 93263]|uniref:cell division protein FtsQ/DivIB n=1 Tax=Chelativorans sp. YIM 93263 TaxID=2906648 RepID=UPI0023781438|nr:cell division protein FtsQ/DivIB [Chelativorans sp. YIM 93263]